MELDPLSDALALIRARCSITGGFAAGGDWAVRFRPESALKVDAIVSGQCWVLVGRFICTLQRSVYPRGGGDRGVRYKRRCEPVRVQP
jgi:hypothetical protein